jgi:hypothetical protein
MVPLNVVARYIEGESLSHEVVFEYTGLNDPESGIVETICSLGTTSVRVCLVLLVAHLCDCTGFRVLMTWQLELSALELGV